MDDGQGMSENGIPFYGCAYMDVYSLFKGLLFIAISGITHFYPPLNKRIYINFANQGNSFCIFD